jgi:hypothetical protein
MKKIIYLGMANKPYEVYETAYIKNFKVVYQYENNNGKRVMLKALKNQFAYYPPCDYKQYVNRTQPILKEGKLYSIDILDKGYSGHYMELVEA